MTQTTEPLVFQHLIESVFVRGIADRLTVEGKAELKKAGIDLARLLPAYSYEVWDKALIAACSLFPELSREDSLRELGHRMLGVGLNRKFAETLLPLFRALGMHNAIRRAMKRQTADNANRTEYTEIDAHTAELKLTHVGAHPEFSQGIFESLLTMLGGKNVRVEIRERQAPSAVYRLTWE